MKFKLITESGVEMWIESGTEINLDIGEKNYIINIEEKELNHATDSNS